MVEHVMTGVERDYLKIKPRPYDEFKAKKVLNAFLQMSDGANTEEHKKAEFELMHETEAWATALGERDRDVSVSDLRLYCENTRPALSSQALLSLGRFYRNSPYSETVRAKFDCVMTRLFSRPGPAGRVLLFSREETISHIKRLYADWSSVPLYTADTNEADVALTALSFEDLATEAENFATFDELIKSDFFARLRTFKESISEVFYAPNVAATALECNIRVGNAYVRLIEREHEKTKGKNINGKYASVNEQHVSDVAGWTLDVEEVIRLRNELYADQALAPENDEAKAATSNVFKFETKQRDVETGIVANIADQFRNINKWVLIFCGLLLLAFGGLWVWANYYAGDDVPSAKVQAITVEGTPLAEYIKTAKISDDTFYGLLNESWDAVPKEKRLEFLQKCLTTAQSSRAKQVQLIDSQGKQAGYASATKVYAGMP
jgi:hypothetical protein